jgi:hypothetical protein
MRTAKTKENLDETEMLLIEASRSYSTAVAIDEEIKPAHQEENPLTQIPELLPPDIAKILVVMCNTTN